MEPVNPAAHPAPRPRAPDSATACSLPWIKVPVRLGSALTAPWRAEAWVEVRQHIRWLLAEQARIRRAGWFNEGLPVQAAGTPST